MSADWRTWSPVLTAITLGTGGRIVAKYRFVGGKVSAILSITLGVGGTVGYNPSVSLPVEAAAEEVTTPYGAYEGKASINISSNVFPCDIVADNLSRTVVRPFGFDATTPGYMLLQPTKPLTWGSGSTLSAKIEYWPTVETRPRTFAAVGDSMTAWRPEQNPYGLSQSWTNFVPDSGLAFAGGWAQGGGTTTWMVANPQPVAADTTVILAGVNDIYQSIPQATTLTNLETIATEAGTDNILLLALAPYNTNPCAALTLTQAEHNLATAKGWSWVDPWCSIRAADGTYLPGASPDGVHPNIASQTAAAAIVRAALENGVSP